MAKQAIPESRSYRHINCGSQTIVSGESFEVVSNPMSSMEQTRCNLCDAMFPIAEFEWSDTGENIRDYYSRYSVNATDLQRFLCSKRLMVAFAVAGAIFTIGGVYILVANDDLFTQLMCISGGAMIGAMMGVAVFLHAFANPITRRVCGVSDTRILQ